MRILIATWNRNVVGGAEKYLQALLPNLIARGHTLGIVHERPISPERETIDGTNIPVSSWNTGKLGLNAALQQINEWQPDVVYVHGLESAELEYALQQTYRALLFGHNYYGTCGTGRKCHSFPEVRPCGRRFGPMCVVLHYPRRCGGLNPIESWRLFRRQWQRHNSLTHYHGIVVASRHMYQEFLHDGAPPEKVHLVPLPVTDLVPLDTAPAHRPLERRILMIGRLTNLKGGSYLIQALQKASEKLGPLRLTVAGDGPEQQKLQQLAHTYGVAVEFTGWVDTPQKMKLIRTADLLALPSLWPEPFGLVGVEAGSLGVPSVAYEVGGISDWLIPGHSGELAPGDPPTIHGLTEAIVRALADPDHYRRLGRGAWEVARRFTMEAHLGKLEPLLSADAYRPLSPAPTFSRS